LQKCFDFFKGLSLLLFIVTLISGCSNDDRLFLERKLTANLSLPSNLNNIETHYFTIKNQQTLFSQTLLQRSLTKDNVISINGTNCTLSSKFGGVDMSFISNVSVRAISTSDRSKKAEMFYLEQIPFSQKSTLRLQTSVSELKDILSNDSFDIEVRLQVRGFIPLGFTLQIDYGYLVFYQ
jgi:hypothetical protein